ncbi:MAG TPA: Fic family protein [Verrucomicrobiae bacterium]
MLRRLGEQKGRQDLYRKQAPEMLDNLRRVAFIESTESSNRIEGVVIPEAKRLRQLMADEVKPANRSEAEIAGYRDVLNTIHQNHAQIAYTDRVVLQLHRDLFKFTAVGGGRWKVTSNEISELRPDGTKRIRFQPLAAHLTEDAMRETHDRYNSLLQAGDWDPLFLVSFYVLDFLCIHPFLDGNGRLARLLSVLALYHTGYEVGRYVSLERIIENTKQSYYDTLYQSSQGWHEGQHEVWPWTEYFLGTLLAAYTEFESRVVRVNSGRGTKGETVRAAVESFLGTFTIQDVERACPTVSRDMIRHVLRELRETGLIEPLGRGRGAKWRKA